MTTPLISDANAASVVADQKPAAPGPATSVMDRSVTINIDARGNSLDVGELIQRYAQTPRADGIEVRRAVVALAPQTINENERSIDMCVSTGASVRRYDWQSGRDYDEVLDISQKAVRLDRLNRGAPLLDSHNYWGGLEAMIGAVVPGTARIEGGELRARALFSRNPAGEAAFQDARQGVLRHVSVGYLTHKQMIDETISPPVYRAIDWEPYEVSAVPMPADPGAGFRSSVPHHQPVSRAEPANMERSMTTANAAGGSPANVAVTVVDEALIAARVEEGIKKERERCDVIAEEGRDLGLSAEFVDGHVKARTALAEFRPLAIKEAKRMRAAVEQEQQQRALPYVAAPSIINGRQPTPRGQEFEVDETRSLSSLAAEARSISRREQRPIKFDDCLSIARRGLGVSIDRKKAFRSLGEQVQAICAYYNSRGTNYDQRLVRAPTGAGETDPTAGGFLVQVDFMASIFMLAHDMGDILSRVNKIPISTNANGLKIPGVDETSRASGSRWGGVVSSWAAEGVAGTESRPKFRLVEFDLKKLISKMTVTDELLQDQAALTTIMSQAFSEEITFMGEDAIVEGSGAGQPLGWINSGAVVSVAKETGQAAATIVKENIDKMWARLWSRSRSNSVWYINQDCIPQLDSLNQAVGTGGQLVYVPAGGLSAAPYSTLKGRPVIETEYNAALGTVGDITLIDPSQYTIVDKGGVQMATSMHVAFDTDESRFRITYRMDGRPMWAAPMTPFKGSLTKSPFITLATR